MVISQINIQETPYFMFETSARRSQRGKIPSEANIELLLEQLANGRNLFEVVPGLTKKHLCGEALWSGSFEKRNEGVVNNERFFSANGYTQVGRLLVPEYRVITRDKIESELISTREEQKRCSLTRVLSDFPHVDSFCYAKNDGYEPIDSKKVLVLSSEQLFEL